VLEYIRQLALANKDLSKGINYLIKEKNETQQTRISAVLRYHGPDTATLDLLTLNENEWLKNPSKFWTIPSSGLSFHNNPQVDGVASCLQLNTWDAHVRIYYRHNCIALYKVRQQQPRLSADDIAAVLIETERYSTWEYKNLVTAANNVITAGSQYILLESDLGQGCTFVLGTEILESLYDCFHGEDNQADIFRWNKYLPRAGDTRKKAIDHLKSKGVVERAQKYKALRNATIDARLASWGIVGIQHHETIHRSSKRKRKDNEPPEERPNKVSRIPSPLPSEEDQSTQFSSTYTTGLDSGNMEVEQATNMRFVISQYGSQTPGTGSDPDMRVWVNQYRSQMPTAYEPGSDPDMRVWINQYKLQMPAAYEAWMLGSVAGG
jgi:hypothetical protein